MEFPLLKVEALAVLSVVMDKSWGGPVAGVGVLLALLLFSSVASVCSLLVLWVLSVFGECHLCLWPPGLDVHI